MERVLLQPNIIQNLECAECLGAGNSTLNLWQTRLTRPASVVSGAI